MGRKSIVVCSTLAPMATRSLFTFTAAMLAYSAPLAC